MAFENIPYELRGYNSWVVWRFEDVEGKKPTKVPYNAKTHGLAKSNDPNTWASYGEALAALNSGMYNGLGFMLSEHDPYCFIDLDDTKGDQTALDRQMKIYTEFNSYAERSPSGTGLHIIIKASLPSGRKRSNIEIYSSVRFMTMTGDVYRNTAIADYNDLANSLWEQMGHGPNNVAVYAGLAVEKDSDEDVLNMAATAANGDKFMALYAGNWQDMYSSQSEADFALVDIIAYYTQNRAQIVRLFRASGLGQREKASRDDYVNYMLNRCFDRMLPPIDFDGLKNMLEEALAKKEAENAKPLSETSEPIEIERPEAQDISQQSSAYPVPPGLVGEIAQFIYAQAPRPIPEIALAGAIGFIAGIVGRAYNISGTGLNQYVLLLAPTGAGKEAIASGIDKLMAQVTKSVPAANDFIGPGEISSAQAIIKYMSKGPTSFVSMVGEFGIYLQTMASPNAPPHLVGLRRFMLDAYNKSGEGKVVRQSIYSDREKNTNAVLAPAFSLLGESTPEKFYEGLHEGLLAEGFLPRFTMIEYHGKVPYLNKNAFRVQPSFDLVDKIASLCAHCLMLNSQHKAIHVQYAPGVEDIADAFNKYCTDNTNSTDRDVTRQLWSRAHMKMLKLASVVAIGCNCYDPTITREIFDWAVNIVLKDTNNLLNRFQAGEIGTDNDETKQIVAVAKCIKDYIVLPWPKVATYAGEGAGMLHANRIIPYSYIQRKLAAAAVFRKDRAGSTAAIKRAIKTLEDRGDLVAVNRAELKKTYETSQVAYMIEHPKAFDL